MRRLVATTVATALLSFSGSSALRHVHAYGGHDHGEHQHGPSAHDHVALTSHHDSHDPTPSASLEGCDPGAHVVATAFTYVATHADHALVPGAVKVFAFTPPSSPWRTTRPADVRAHSPPRLTDAPLRAPPVVHLA